MIRAACYDVGGNSKHTVCALKDDNDVKETDVTRA
jgi:hypothetical protein